MHGCIAILLIFIAPGSMALGQGESGIQGRITAAGTGAPLAGVNVLVEGTFIGAASDLDGYYQIKKLPPGRYTVFASMIGYRNTRVADVIVPQGTVVSVDLALERDILKSPQIVVTATRMEQDIMESPISVSVVGLRQLLDKGAVSLDEVIEYESGVALVKGQLNIRGSSGYTMGAGSRSLLLIDGVSLLGSAAGNIVWTVVPASEIERVEIIKSAGSALYGSSAMGGVINIITRNAPPRPETRLRVRLGRYSRPKHDQWRWRESPGLLHTAEATHARPYGDHSGWLRVQRNYSPGFTRLNWLDAWNLTGKLKFNFGSRYSSALYANYYSESKGLESVWKSPAAPFEAPAGSEHDKGIGQKVNINGVVNYIYSPTMVVRVKAAWYDVWWKNQGTNKDYSNERKYFTELQAATNWTSALSTTTGLVCEQAGIRARIFGKHNSRTTAGYLQARQKIGNWLLSSGGRYEQYYVDGKNKDQSFAPSLAVNWRRYTWLSLRASAGGGFRVPTVAEMFSRSQLNVFKVEPNPDLASEKSVSLEAGGAIVLPAILFKQLNLDASVFVNNFENLIEPVPDHEGIIHFENITRARIAGQEVSMTALVPGEWALWQLTYTHLDPVALSGAGEVIDTLSYRYRHNLFNTVKLYVRGATLTFEYRYASRLDKTELFDENPRSGQDRRVPLHLINMSLGRTFYGWETLLRVENLFQYYYVELERNMASERLLTLTLNHTF